MSAFAYMNVICKLLFVSDQGMAAALALQIIIVVT
jgi:hypothetical protein